MLVQDVMTNFAEYIHPDTKIDEASRKMRELNCGSLPVGENDRLVGFVTDRDIVIRSVAEGKNAADHQVRDVMSEGVVYCRDSQDLEEASDLMKENQVRRLIVLNDDKRMIGMLSLGDIARSDADVQLSGELVSKLFEN